MMKSRLTKLLDKLEPLQKPDPKKVEAYAKAARLRDQQELKRAEEHEAERLANRKLALKLIDHGYRSMAAKLHSNRGGSAEDMARLTAIRDQLKKLL
jgi:hypothetical protein